MTRRMIVIAVLLSSCSKGSPPEATPSAAPSAAVVPAAPAAPPAASVSAAASAVPAPDPAIRYAVFGVKAGDVLNVRAEPDSKSKKVFSFGPSVRTIRPTGRTQNNEETLWMEVAFEGGTGWVNRAFVLETKPGYGCNDAKLTAVIRQFMRAVDSSDGAALQEIVTPVRALIVRKAADKPSVRIPSAEAGGIFTSGAVKNFGTPEAPLNGSFKSVFLPALRENVTGKGAKEACGKLLAGAGAELVWPDDLAGLIQVSFHKPEAEKAPFHTTVAGLEYVDGKPYFAALVQFEPIAGYKVVNAASDATPEAPTPNANPRVKIARADSDKEKSGSESKKKEKEKKKK